MNDDPSVVMWLLNVAGVAISYVVVELLALNLPILNVRTCLLVLYQSTIFLCRGNRFTLA